MKTTALRKIGNSQGIIIDKSILDLAGLDEKTIFKVEISGDEITLKPLSKKEQKDLIKKAALKVAKDHKKTFEKLSK